MRRIRLVGAIVTALLIAGGGAAWAMSGSSGPSYRTATAQLASITQTLNSVGVVHAVNKETVTFPVSGRVSSVPVTLGQVVTAGQVLATLDTTALDQAVAQAKQTVAQDQLKLANDQNGQAGGTSNAINSGGSAAPAASGSSQLVASPSSSLSPAMSSSSSSSTSGRPGPSGPSAAVAAAQQRLLHDQKSLDAVLSDHALSALRALVASSGPCAMSAPKPTTFVASTDASGTLTVTTPEAATVDAGSAQVSAPASGPDGDTVTITGTADTSYTVTVTPVVGSIDATSCTAAVQSVVSSLAGPGDDAWTAAQAVSADELALSKAITALSKSSASTTTSSSSAATASGRSASTRATQGTGSQQSAVAVASPEQLAADQAAIDAASAELAVAQQNLAQATIRSPISGTVAAIGLTVGASAGGNAITVIASGTYAVSTTVSLTDLDLLKVGDLASVRVDGITTPLTGRVSMIGVLDSSTGSTTTFPVTVALDPSTDTLFDGAGAAVAITVGQVQNVVSVPSSAVHSLGSLHTVTVLANGKATVTRVGIGAVGTDRTQITSGLTAGQRVVLAQLNAPLPSSNTTNGRFGVGGAGLGGGGLGGGLGGGGLGGGGGVVPKGG